MADKTCPGNDNERGYSFSTEFGASAASLTQVLSTLPGDVNDRVYYSSSVTSTDLDGGAGPTIVHWITLEEQF
jgi:hypothetical protein